MPIPTAAVVKLYPNPADNILVIDGSNEINCCEIYNLTGQLVKLVSDGKVFTRKFVKK